MAVAAHYLCRHRVAHGDCLEGAYSNAATASPQVGWDPLPDQVYINTNYAPLPCGGQAGTFGVTGPCWTHEQPVVEIRASGAETGPSAGRGLPGLARPAVGAGHGGRDRRVEEQPAVAGVDGAVERTARVPDPLCRLVALGTGGNRWVGLRELYGGDRGRSGRGGGGGGWL